MGTSKYFSFLKDIVPNSPYAFGYSNSAGREKCAKETRVPMDIPSDVIDMSSLFTSENPFCAQIVQIVSVVA